MMISPMVMHRRRRLGYHAKKLKMSGDVRYIRPIAQVPMIGIFREPANGRFEV
jgi:hypothetical protein